MIRELLPHQQRVIVELDELKEKLIALGDFLSTEMFKSLDSIDKELLTNQYYIMADYADILQERIERF